MKYGFSPDNSRNSRVVSSASTESYESGDVHFVTTAASDGLRVVRLFEGNVRSAFHTLGVDMIKQVGLDPKADEQEVVVVPHEEESLRFTSKKAYDDHLDKLAGLSVSGTKIEQNVPKAAESDDDDDDDDADGLVVEDVTGQLS